MATAFPNTEPQHRRIPQRKRLLASVCDPGSISIAPVGDGKDRENKNDGVGPGQEE